MFSNTLLQKFFPYNNGEDNDIDDDLDFDPYGSDHFRMFEFKVRRCTRSRSHDWTDCPFAHPGEKARRRDPRRFHYSGNVCSEFRRGGCSRGDSCEFSHGVFECWLHPARYRTEPCKDGKNCKRKICFFAHSLRELRVLPENFSDQMYRSSGAGAGSGGCKFCQSLSSPTSTLVGVHNFSPPVSPAASLSPPVSPIKHRSLTGFSPISRYSDGFSNSGISSYKDAVSELMNSFESMNLNENCSVKSSDPDFGWVNDLLM